MLTRFRRVYLIAITLLLCACNDYEPAQHMPSNEQAPPLEASIAAFVNAGHIIENAQPVANAPLGEGFSVVAASQTGAGAEVLRHISDSRQAITLAGSANHQAQSTALGSLWVQRQGEQAALLNPGSENAIALLPHVAAPTQLTFGFIAANTAGYIGEQLTTVAVLPSDAPFAVDTNIQYQQAAQVLLNVSLNAPATQNVTLRYSTSDGSALANRDYLPTQGQLTFEPGQSSLMVTVPLLGSAAAAPNNDDRYFKLLVSGELDTFSGTVLGYGVILSEMVPNNSAQSVSESTVTQDALAGSAGEQRVHLARPSPALRLTLNIRCQESDATTNTISCLDDSNRPILENSDLWQNISVPSTLAATKRYLLTNSSDTALDYTVYIFDGDIRREVTGQLAANSQILVYTAFGEPIIDNGSANSSASNNSSTSNNSSASNNNSSTANSSSSANSSSQPALMASTLNIEAQPQGIGASTLQLHASFNDEIAINSLNAELNSATALAINSQVITIPYAQLTSGMNVLTVSASDATGETLVRTLHLYYGGETENTFTGDGATNIFIGEQGRDTFTGGDGNNIYIHGAGTTTFNPGSGQNIFIYQAGAAPMSLTAIGTTNDEIILPASTIAQALVRQAGEQNVYVEIRNRTSESLEADMPSVFVMDYFATDGSVQSSIQRISFADGVLTAADIRRLIHTAAPGNSAYWGFSGDDILIDTDGDDAAFGGAGNDTIHVNGYAEGGEGNDIITAFHGAGGAGNDEIHAISNATGGDGDDILYTQDFAQGESGNDILHGDDNDNSLHGGLGDDTLYGYGGDDGLFGGAGNNTFYGGDGDDSLFAAEGDFNDTLFGGDGNDKLWGYDGDNYFDGGNGNETFFAGHGNNTIICGEGNHSIFGNDDGNDTITCGSGVDQIFIEGGNDQVDSGAGNDSLFGAGGNKQITTGDGDDEIHINSGDNCTIDTDSGDDLAYVDCNRLIIDAGSGQDSLIASANWQLEITGGLGDDNIQFSGRPYYSAQPAAPLTPDEMPYTHIFWAPGEGNDIYTISGYDINTESDNTALTKNNNATLANEGLVNIARQAVSTATDLGLPSTHFYLGGSATLEGMRFEQADATSLLLHYHDATTGIDETLTFNYWFDWQTGLSTSEKFYDFVFPDLSSIKTATISAHFNNLFYRNFDTHAEGFTSFGTPMASDKLVINDISMMVDSENYLIRNELTLAAPSWTLEFWVAMPELPAAITPILQWGESADGSDGFGLVLINSGEGMYWSLMNGTNNIVDNYTYNYKPNINGSGDAQHIALVFNNNAITLYVNGEPSTATLQATYDNSPRPLTLGYFNMTGAANLENASQWYIDELLINYSEANYNGAFLPEAKPFDIDYVPSQQGGN